MLKFYSYKAKRHRCASLLNKSAKGGTPSIAVQAPIIPLQCTPVFYTDYMHCNNLFIPLFSAMQLRLLYFIYVLSYCMQVYYIWYYTIVTAFFRKNYRPSSVGPRIFDVLLYSFTRLSSFFLSYSI